MLTPATRCMNLEDNTLSEAGQQQEDKCCVTPFRGSPLESNSWRQTAEAENQAWWPMRGSWHLTGMELLFPVMKMFQVRVVMVTQGCKHRQCCWVDIRKWLKWPDNYCALPVCRLSRSSRVRLFCDAMGCSSPGSPVPAILQARTLERLSTTSSRGSSRTRESPSPSCLLYWQAGSSPLQPAGKPHCAECFATINRERIGDGTTLWASGPAQRHWQTTASRTPARGPWAVT